MTIITPILQIKTKALRNSVIADRHPADLWNSKPIPRGLPGPSSDPSPLLDPPRTGSLSGPFSAPRSTPRSFLRSRRRPGKRPGWGWGIGSAPPSPGAGGCRDSATYFHRGAGRPPLAGPQPCWCRPRALPGPRPETWRPPAVARSAGAALRPAAERPGPRGAQGLISRAPTLRAAATRPLIRCRAGRGGAGPGSAEASGCSGLQDLQGGQHGPIPMVWPERLGSLSPIGSGWCQVRFVEPESPLDHSLTPSWQGVPKNPFWPRCSHPGWQPLHLVPQACTFSRVTSEPAAVYPWL